MPQSHTLIIGGTKGMGHSTAEYLAHRGHTVSAVGRNPPKEEEKQNLSYWSLDLLEKKEIPRVLEESIEKNGKINNILFFQRYRGEGNGERGEIAVSLEAPQCIIEYAKERFDETRENSIIFISSLASNFIAEEQGLDYHMAKAGLQQMVKYYAVTLGRRKIRVNSISPSTVLKKESFYHFTEDKDLSDLYRKITPLERMVTAEDIASTIFFLCEPKAPPITGQNIIIDGGTSLQWHESLGRSLYDKIKERRK